MCIRYMKFIQWGCYILSLFNGPLGIREHFQQHLEVRAETPATSQICFSVTFGICESPGTDPPQILRSNCILLGSNPILFNKAQVVILSYLPETNTSTYISEPQSWKISFSLLSLFSSFLSCWVILSRKRQILKHTHFLCPCVVPFENIPFSPIFAIGNKIFLRIQVFRELHGSLGLNACYYSLSFQVHLDSKTQ